MAEKKRFSLRIILIITVSMAVIIFYGATLALFGMTLVRPLWVVVGAVVFAAASCLAFGRKWAGLTGTRNVVINVICNLVAVSGLAMALFLGVNYFGRNKAETVNVRGEVMRVYAETHYRTKRVARNRYTRGEPYKVYYMDVRLPDGRERKREISLKRYNRYARSSYICHNRPDSVDLRLTPGALGMTVIEPDPQK